MSNIRSIKPKDRADFTPELGNYKALHPFRYWCQKVLPLVYDDSLSYYELLCKVVDYLNKTMEDVETLHDDVTNLHEAYEELQSYVNDYFSTLDVQEEINNKLDELVENGTLTNLIRSTITLNPIVVDSVTNMKDKGASYILSSNSHVYQWGGTNFTDTGVVWGGNITNAITFITSLSTINYADVLPDVNNASIETVYELNFGSGDTNIPANLPFTEFPDSTLLNLFTFGTTDNKQKTQMLIDYSNTTMYFRRTGGGYAWGEWCSLYVSDCLTFKQEVNKSNYTNILPNLNDASTNTIYELNVGDIDSNVPLNLPQYYQNNSLCDLFTFGAYNSNQKTQIIFDYSGNIFMRRTGASYVWTDWISIISYTEMPLTFKTRLTTINYADVLPDVNNASIETVYELNFDSGDTNIPANLPFTEFPDSTLLNLFTFGTTNNNQKTQMLIDYSNTTMYFRRTGGGYAWGEWSSLSNSINRETVIVSPNDNVLSILINKPGSNIIFTPGTYDIIELYKKYAGDDYFNTYDDYNSGGNSIGRGLPCYKNTHWICMPNAIFTCNYTGENENVGKNFAAVALESNVTIDGLQLTYSGVRDGIHDDFDTNNTYDKTILKNCVLNGPNRGISGGMSVAGIIEITDCIFNTEQNDSFWYHNNAYAGAKTKLSVSGCYITNNVRFQPYGASELVSTITLTNNYIGGNIVKDSAIQTIDNLEIKGWNNTNELSSIVNT